MFDPETGERVSSGGVPVRDVRRRPANPWDRALTAVWAGALMLAAVLLLSAVALASTDSGTGPLDPATRLLVLFCAALLVAVAVLTAVAQLAVRAATWRPAAEDGPAAGG